MAKRPPNHARAGRASRLAHRLGAVRTRAQQSWLASTLMPGSLTAAVTAFGLRLSRAEPYLHIRVPEWETGPIGTLSLVAAWLVFRLLARRLGARFNRRTVVVTMVAGLSIVQMAESLATNSETLMVLSFLVGVQCVESLARGLVTDNVPIKPDRFRSGRVIRRDRNRRSALTTAVSSGALGLYDVVFPLSILFIGTRATFIWFGAATLPLAGLGWLLLPDDVNKLSTSARPTRISRTAERSIVLVGRVSFVNGCAYGISVGVLSWVLHEHFGGPGRPAYLALLLLAVFSLRRLPTLVTNTLAERLATRPDPATAVRRRPHRLVRPAALPEAGVCMVWRSCRGSPRCSCREPACSRSGYCLA
jgi:MFS family permease